MAESTSPKINDAPKADRLSVFHFYVWLAFGTLVYLSDQLDRLLDLSLILPLLLLVATATVAIISLTGIVRGLRGDQPKALASVLCAPVLTLALFGGLLKFHIDPDWIRFQIVRPWYLKQIAKSPESSPKHHQWNWGETGSAIGPNFFHRLVYDESDAPLRGQPSAKELNISIDVRPLGNHFFLVTGSR
ncbi:hypothetical protein [Paraburkholderia tropica]|uniref:hypothetical protein n=1 Tax=Paraburkholderia tropica TaxID=92647 RepID=UPI002AB248EE|nr:hypothetical protein [Paraburkholderia tropica]